MNQRKVVPRVVFLEHCFAESNEQHDEGDDDENHQRYADQLLFVDHGASCPHVRDKNAPQTAALAHEPRGAVTVEGAMSVHTHAAVLTLAPWFRGVTFVYVFPATTGREEKVTAERPVSSYNA